MLIAAANIAVAFAVLAAAPAAAPVTSIPPMRVIVSVAPDIAPHVVTALLAETDAVWRTTGIRFLWQRDDSRASAWGRGSPVAAPAPGTLRVIVGHETHSTSPQYYPLGWIVFDGPATPEREIHISYRNARSLLEHSPGVVGAVSTMPMLKIDILLARAMGRALAHELGHYLSASKVHTPKGLMMAVHSAAEFFGPNRGRFTLDPGEWQRIAARLTSIYMAS